MLTSLNPELMQFINKLNRVDFGPLAYQLINGEGWMMDRTIDAIEQYRRFLVLNYLYPDRKLAPSRIVDIVWHTAILDTSTYYANCIEIFGYFLHHLPEVGTIDEADKRTSTAAFADTCQLMKRHFI